MHSRFLPFPSAAAELPASCAGACLTVRLNRFPVGHGGFGIGILRFLVRYRDAIPCDEREILLRAPESRDPPPLPPQVCGCVEPSALQLLFVLEYRDIVPTGMNVVVAK